VGLVEIIMLKMNISVSQRALHSHDGSSGDNNNPGDHTASTTSVGPPAFGGTQPGLDYSMQRSPRDALYPPHMVSSHIQSNLHLFTISFAD